MHLELELLRSRVRVSRGLGIHHSRTGTLASGVPLQLAAGLGGWLGPKGPGVGCA
jgi:hypothetical protein